MLGRGVGREGAAARVLRCCSVVAGGIPLPLVLGLAATPRDEIGAPDGLGSPDLCRFEIDALHSAHNIKDRCGSRAGAVCSPFDRIPPPERMLVLVVWV